MALDSSVAGFLAPAATPAPTFGQSLNRFIQQYIVGITALPGKMVRPRWQPEPPNIESAGTVWCGFGLQRLKADTFAHVSHVYSSDVVQRDELRRHEQLELLLSFYDLGIDEEADKYASIFRDGVQIAQNREILRSVGIGIVETGEVLTVPVLTKQRWMHRVDLPLIINRQIIRYYPVLNILSAEVGLKAEESDVLVVDETIVVNE